jgi:DNA ligase D-like protein (predicted 3'-phosphoesterase)
VEFIIQEFRSSSKPDQARYYLRLERDGVFQGWAVPKGIPDQTGVKRLAIHVGDYRSDQAEFSGQVAGSQYGPGEISIWDKGEYLPFKWTGQEIGICLMGKKAKGSYSLKLVEFPKTGEKNWLLEKKKEAAAVPAASSRSEKPAKSSSPAKTPVPGKPRKPRKKAAPAKLRSIGTSKRVREKKKEEPVSPSPAPRPRKKPVKPTPKPSRPTKSRQVKPSRPSKKASTGKRRSSAGKKKPPKKEQEGNYILKGRHNVKPSSGSTPKKQRKIKRQSPAPRRPTKKKKTSGRKRKKRSTGFTTSSSVFRWLTRL